MAIHKYFVGLAFFCLFAFTSNAQIVGVGEHHTVNTVPNMPIYVYFADVAIGELRASTPTLGQVADFVWEEFDESTLTYTHIKTDNAELSSTISGMGSGGYRVTRNDGLNPQDTLYAWIILDHLEIGNIVHANTCDALALIVHHSAQLMYSYYDLSKTPEERIYFSSNPKITWTTVPENVYDGLEIEASWKTSSIRSLTLSTTEIRNPAPLATATYTATITNDFGNTSGTFSTPQIPAIAVYAAMKAEEQKADDTWVETKTLTGSALYKLRFDHSESKNADTYRWIGYDNYENVQTRDGILWAYSTNSPTDKAYVTYRYLGEELDGYIPGKYRDSLIVINSVTGCRDSADLQYILGDGNPFVIVEPSKFDSQAMPNVFTPNGDGINDVFKFVTGNEPVSMKTMNLRIFDRAGKELYKYEGRVSDWQGWNGKIKGTGADCPVGVYYYDISGTGWDNKSYSGKPYRGFVHLFKE